jgi:hypothetical protein
VKKKAKQILYINCLSSRILELVLQLLPAVVTFLAPGCSRGGVAAAAAARAAVARG